MPRHYVAVVLARRRTQGDKVWFEYLVEKARDGKQYEFPQGPGLEAVLARVTSRKMFFPPRNIADLDPCLQHTHTLRDVEFRLYLVHFEATQWPKADRRLPPRPHFIWVAGAELSGHVHLGPPSVCGLPVAPSATALFGALPRKLQYASATPPLTLYHGTTGAACKTIAKTGLLPTATPGMLGVGVYFARWDKAISYAGGEDGVVVRCLVFPGKTRTMGPDDICGCGCGQAYTDHATTHGKDFTTTYVPDNSLPATKRAEWCVRDPTAVVVDCTFDCGDRDKDKDGNGSGTGSGSGNVNVAAAATDAPTDAPL